MQSGEGEAGKSWSLLMRVTSLTRSLLHLLATPPPHFPSLLLLPMRPCLEPADASYQHTRMLVPLLCVPRYVRGYQ